MEVFYEYMVEKKKTNREAMIRMGSIAVAILLTLMTILFLFGRIMGFEVFIIFAVWYGVAAVFKRTDVEFEYILTNSAMDVDKIMSKKARKRLVTVDFKAIEVCQPADKIEAPSGVTIMDCTGDIDAGSVYYVDFLKNSQRTRLFFQPNAKILQSIKQVNPRQITVNEGDLQ